MYFYEIKPYVRYVAKYSDNDSCFNSLTASYDHLMIYVVGGMGKITIDDQQYHLSRGTVTIVKPGIFFVITESEQLGLFTVHFDYTTDNASEKSDYVKPASPENFKASKICDVVDIRGEENFNSIVHITGLNSMEEYFNNLVAEYKRCDKYYDLKMCCNLTSILVEIARKLKNANIMEQSDENSKIEEIVSYIHENYALNIGIESIAKKFGFHPVYINVLFKNKTGYSIHKYIMMRRVTRAIELLQESNMKIYEIAEKMGFSDVCHFSKCFKQIMGKSPSKFRSSDKKPREE